MFDNSITMDNVYGSTKKIFSSESAHRSAN